MPASVRKTTGVFTVPQRLHSCVSIDSRKNCCIHGAPTAEAVRRTASRNDLPIARITEVRMLEPYFYR